MTPPRRAHGRTVTVAIPVLNEEAYVGACLDAVAAQSWPHVVEVLVVDGGSTDRTREIATSRSGVRVLDNPRRLQAAALNVALAEAQGEVFVRVDGHCSIAPDYVERCVDALERTGAAMVGGAMRSEGRGWMQRGIAAAMASPLGAGPARFHGGGRSRFVDTVYLGAYGTDLARHVGGYATDVGVNEDAELAIRMRPHGGIWMDDGIRSTYVPRGSLTAVGRQFYRYGRSRAATARRHPRSIAPRQVAAPLMVLALCSPWRRKVIVAYSTAIATHGLCRAAQDPGAALGLTLTMPTMHLSWGVGFLRGLALPQGATAEAVNPQDRAPGERLALDRQRHPVAPRLEPRVDVSCRPGLLQGASTPDGDVHDRRRYREMASRHQQAVPEPETRDPRGSGAAADRRAVLDRDAGVVEQVPPPVHEPEREVDLLGGVEVALVVAPRVNDGGAASGVAAADEVAARPGLENGACRPTERVLGRRGTAIRPAGPEGDDTQTGVGREARLDRADYRREQDRVVIQENGNIGCTGVEQTVPARGDTEIGVGAEPARIGHRLYGRR